MNNRTTNYPNEETGQASSLRATAYVVTFLPCDGSGLGHTSLYVVGENGQTFERSFFPSGHFAAAKFHNSTFGLVPVPGFITKGLASDVKYEGAPPVSVLEVAGLNFGAMMDEHQAFTARVATGAHGFSLRYNGLINPLNYLYYSQGALWEQKSIKNRTGLHSLVTEDPFAGTTMSSEEDNVPSISLGNCTDCVHRALTAGGLTLNQGTSNRLFTLFSATGHHPRTFMEDLQASGAKEVLHSPGLPSGIKSAVSMGEALLASRDVESEQIGTDLLDRMRRYSSF